MIYFQQYLVLGQTMIFTMKIAYTFAIFVLSSAGGEENLVEKSGNEEKVVGDSPICQKFPDLDICQLGGSCKWSFRRNESGLQLHE